MKRLPTIIAFIFLAVSIIFPSVALAADNILINTSYNFGGNISPLGTTTLSLGGNFVLYINPSIGHSLSDIIVNNIRQNQNTRVIFCY